MLNDTRGNSASGGTAPVDHLLVLPLPYLPLPSMPGLVHPDNGVCDAISARLSTLSDLRLPACLLREHPYPTPTEVQQHLQQLLHRDAAVFLERYGSLLSAEELSSFEALRQDYEVDYFLKQAEAALDQTVQQQQQQHEGQSLPGLQQTAGLKPGQLSSTVKNRRLAYMRRLEQKGEYFSEHAMRERQPLVWQECIGRHEGHPAPQAVAVGAGERGFAGSLLASYDEAMLRARLQQEMEDEEAAMSEHDSDDTDMDEDDTAPAQHQQQQQQHQHQQNEQQQQQGQEELPPDTQSEQQQGLQQAPSAASPPTSIKAPTAASAGRTEAARAGAAAAARAGPQQQPQQQQPLVGCAAVCVDLGPEAMARRRQEFLLEMQHRFLDGLDGEHHSYSLIDADTSLDDDWAKEQDQDAEDAYFDAD